MNENVVAFGQRAQDTDRRAEFLNHVAASFDKYVANRGYEPDALAMAWSGVGMGTTTSWLVTGESEKSASLMLAMAGAALSHDAVTQ